MNLLSALRVAVETLLLHKGRSALTSLGIVIGIGSVIALVAAGEGARWTLDDRMGSIGKNLVLVRSGARARSGAVADQTPLRSADAALVRQHLGPLLRGVAAVQITKRTISSSGRSQHNWPTTVSGTTPDLKDVREWRLAAGRFFTTDEVRRAADVCVIGATIRRKLFPGTFGPGQV